MENVALAVDVLLGAAVEDWEPITFGSHSEPSGRTEYRLACGCILIRPKTGAEWVGQPCRGHRRRSTRELARS